MKPRHYLIRMSLFLFFIFSLCIFVLPVLVKAFLANMIINSLILSCFGFGVVFMFMQVHNLSPEVDWLEAFRDRAPFPPVQTKLLSPLINVFKESSGTNHISTLSMRSLIDSVDARLDDSREISRFLPGLLVFLGLLGTFWGLVQTVGSIADVISNLNFTGLSNGANVETSSTAFFDQLKVGLKEPLAGMGLAFSASMFGLAGSLILSFLDLQASQAYKTFSRDLEEWLSTLARLPISSMDSEKGIGGGAGYTAALMEQTHETINQLFRMLKETEGSKSSLNNSMTVFSEKVSKLADQMKTEQALMVKIAESQIELQTIIKKLAEMSSFGMDDRTKANFRNIEVFASKIADELPKGRKEMVDEIRNEIRLLSKTISNLAEN